MSERLMRIGELAQRTGLSHPTIRHYDETGLLTPSGRTAGNFRLYSEADYERLMVIRRMKPLGFTIEEMRQLLAIVHALRDPRPIPPEQHSEVLSALQSYIEDAIHRRQKLQRQVDRADEFITVLRREETASRSVQSGAGSITAGPGTS